MQKAKRLWIFSASVLLLLWSVQVAQAQSELIAKMDELADKLTSSVSGEVATVEGDIIYINLGEKDCVYEGSQFEVVRLGEVVMVGNKAIHKERPIGEIQITKVRKDMSLAKATTSFAQVEKGDKVYQKRKKVTRIALTEFPYGENLNNLTKNIYESLSVSFSQKGMQVVERSQLEKLLQEHKISYSGIIDISTAQRLGQLLGTEAILLGTVTDIGNNAAIRARLVDVGKGVVITSAQVEIVKNPEILAMLEEKRPDIGGASPGSTNKPGDSKKSGLFFENDFLRIEVLSFSREASGLMLKLRFLNKTQAPFSVNVDDRDLRGTYIVDNLSNEYRLALQGNPGLYGSQGMELLERRGVEIRPQVPRVSHLLFRKNEGGGKDFTFTSKFEYHQGRQNGNLYVTIEGITLR